MDDFVLAIVDLIISGFAIWFIVEVFISIC